MPDGIYGPALGHAYGHAGAPYRTTRTAAGHTLAATAVCRDAPGFGRSKPLPRTDASMVVVPFAALSSIEWQVGGRTVFAGAVDAGHACLIDLAMDPIASCHEAYDAIHFHIPADALLEFSVELCRAPVRRLLPPAGTFTDDPVLRAIGECVGCQVTDGYAGDQLLVDHAMLALLAHLAVRYGGGELNQPRQRAGLAPWQQRRAIELLSARLTDGIALKELARECCLSESGLLRAFTTSMGTSPHRWLSLRRVELAMELLRTTDQSLVDVAVATGFADQAHFTRVFGKHVGTSPGAWRRQLARDPSATQAA